MKKTAYFILICFCFSCKVISETDVEEAQGTSPPKTGDINKIDLKCQDEYNALILEVESLLSGKNPFDTMKLSINKMKEANEKRKECGLILGSKAKKIKDYSSDLQASAEQLLKADSTNKDLQERVNFYKELASLIPNEP
jgi:hypothetical protein